MNIKTVDRTTAMQYFDIKVPIWASRAVGLAEYKISNHNKIDITYKNKDGERVYPQTLYVSGQDARKYPLKKYGHLEVREIPIVSLSILEVNNKEKSNEN